MLKIDWNPSEKKLREFGYFGLVGFALVAWAIGRRTGVWHGHAGPIAQGFTAFFGALALACPLLSLAKPAALRPVWLAIVFITAPIGFVVGNLVMGLIYWGVVTPIALVLRLLGNDPMQRRIDPQAATYWQVRPPTPPKSRYFRQF